MPSTDFGSNNKSPGGWGGSGSAAAGGQGGMGGQKSSAGNYNYRGIPGTSAIGNYNTGGPMAGFGNQYGVSYNDGISSGPIRPALGPQGMPTPFVPPPPAVDPVVAALTPRLISQRKVRFPSGIQYQDGVQPETAPQGIGGRPPGAAFGYTNATYSGMGRGMQSGATPQRYGPEGVKSW